MHYANNKFPFVTIIIPAYNEEKYIAKCLEKWVNQDYPKDSYEILVFDGMSTDKTAKIVKEFERKYPELVKYRKNPKRRQVYAFNMGIQEARGDFFVIFSAHAYPRRDFLKKSVETFFKVKEKEPKLIAVGGIHDNLYENGLAKFVGLIYQSPLSGSSPYRYSTKPDFVRTIAYAMYEKETIIKHVGLFDKDMVIGDDFEFNLRINKHGYKLFLNPEIKSYYYTRSTWSGFLKQSFNYGAAKGVIIRKGYFSPIWLSPLGFIALEILIPLWGTLIWLFAFYWLLLVGESFRLWKRTKNTEAFFLPPMMWFFHNLISIGFLAGLLLGSRSFR